MNDLASLVCKQVILIRSGGELGVKSRRTRKRMVSNLIKTLKEYSGYNQGFKIFEYRDRLILELDDNTYINEYAESISKTISGISSLSIAFVGSSNEEDLLKFGLTFSKKNINTEGSFAVRVNREGKHPYSSLEIASKLGALIKAKIPDLKVDLDTPENKIYLDIRGDYVFYYTDKIVGIDGIPTKSQGKSVAIIKPNTSSLFAAWLMKKRGVEVIPIFFKTDKKNYLDYMHLITKEFSPNSYLIDISGFLNENQSEFELCLICQLYCEKYAEKFAQRENLTTIISPTCFNCKNETMNLKALTFLEKNLNISVIRPIQMHYYGDRSLFQGIDALACCTYKTKIEIIKSNDKTYNLNINSDLE